MDKAGTIPFMVQEYVDGTNLHQLIAANGPLPVNRAVEYIRQSAIGLHAAHMVGLIHRDIKPGNLLLARSGMVKILDLGLARFMQDSSRNNDLTARFDDNSILGTADFIAPEQTMNSSKVDIRADIYSLGHTFYYLLAGKMAFGEGSAAQKLIWHQMRQPEPVSMIRREVPAKVQAVLEKMMEKSPDDRYQTPAEVVEALRPLLPGPVPPPPAAEMPRVRPSSYLLGLSPPPDSAIHGLSDGQAAPSTPAPGNTPSKTGRSAARPTPPRGTPHTGDVTGRTGRQQPRSGELFRDATPPESDPREDEDSPRSGSYRYPDGYANSPRTPRSDANRNENANSPPAKRKLPLPLLIGGALALFAIVGLALYVGGVFDEKKPTTPVPPRNQGGGTEPPPLKKEDATPPKTTPTLTLRGGGSTFVAPIMDFWANRYEKEFNVKIEYERMGSSKGVNGVLGKFLNFGCTDAYIPDEQFNREKIPPKSVVHIPLVMGAVVVTYNVPDVKEQLKFTGGVLVDIYTGKITHWDDPAITANNTGVKLPHLPITPVRRSEGSGTTFIFTDYLCQIDGTFSAKIGGPKNLPTWPPGSDGKEIGLAGEGNDGVAAEVRKTTGSIGYVELSFALSKSLAYGQVQNSKNKFINPTLDRITVAAANKLESIPDDLRYTITNAPGEGSYPICGTAWAVIYVDLPAARAKDIVKFLRWCVHEGQKDTRELKYAQLPEELVQKIDKILDKIPGGK